MKTAKVLKIRHFIVMAMCFFALSASAQLKVSSTGKVSVGTTSASSSALSVNSTGNSNYAAYINGNCKVDSGYLKANLYNPTYSTGTQGNISNGVACLLSLTPVQYTTSSRDGGEEDNEIEVISPSGERLIIVPNAHYAITGSDMNYYFPLLTTQDENNNYIANYPELIPLIIKLLQVHHELISDLMHSSKSGSSISEEDGEGQQEGDGQPQSRPRISQMLNGAVLYQNTPNPFREKTEIRFRLPEGVQNAYVYIFDMTGKTLRQLPVDSSMQSVTLAGYELSAGMYLYSLVVNGQEVDTKRMILSK